MSIERVKQPFSADHETRLQHVNCIAEKQMWWQGLSLCSVTSGALWVWLKPQHLSLVLHFSVCVNWKVSPVLAQLHPWWPEKQGKRNKSISRLYVYLNIIIKRIVNIYMFGLYGLLYGLLNLYMPTCAFVIEFFNKLF